MSAARPAGLLDLPLSDYGTILNLQRACVMARKAGTLDRDLVILVEHPPVFTLGRRGGRDNLHVSETQLEARGIRLIPVERGGDITYHGPGQLVVYPIIDLNRCRLKVVELVNALEDAMLRTAADWGVLAEGRRPQRGVWVDHRKLGSLGITIRRGVSFHGLALNITTDLEPFRWINPCGLTGCTMTSLERETGTAVDMRQVRTRMAGHLAALLDLEWSRFTPEALKAVAGMEETAI